MRLLVGEAPDLPATGLRCAAPCPAAHRGRALDNVNDTAPHWTVYPMTCTWKFREMWQLRIVSPLIF